MEGYTEQERPVFGKRVNEIRDRITAALESKISELKRIEKDARLIAEKVDITLPGKNSPSAGLHPLTRNYL